MRLLHLLTTGGTIASAVDPVTGAAVPALGAAEIVAMVPALGALAEIRVTELWRVASWAMDLARMIEVARAAQALAADPATAGVIVTHGTDTLEETAFALDLLLGGDTPVVLTGAMRNTSLPGHDGPRNLLAAARAALAPAAWGLGVLVVMNEEIHAARRVSKTHASALGAFASPGLGPIGWLDDGGARIALRPVRAPTLPMAAPAEGVYLVKMASGMDPLLLRAILDAGARGVVIEGSGSGNVHPSWEDPIRALVEAHVPVVLCSRCGGGRVTPSYGAPGGGRRLYDLGVIPGGDLTGPKARVALLLARGAGLDAAAIRAYFEALAT
jgi:L-asparaginase